MAEMEKLRDSLGSWHWLLLVGAALEAGLFRSLGARALTLDDLVQELALDRRAAFAVAEALAEGGFLAHEDGRYRATAEARRLLVDEQDAEYMAPSALHNRNLAARWLHLPDILKGNRPPEQERTETATFTATMAIGARGTAAALVQRCLARFPSTRRVLDVGGGPGVDAGEFLAQGVDVTILDLPEVVDLVRPQWAGTKGVTLVAGDFTVGLPEGPFDLALLGNVCHIYGPAENRRLFERVAAVLPPGGGIAILDFVRGRSPIAALFGVNMLANTASGGTWTEAEYREWLAAAGFQALTVEDLRGPGQQLILGQLAGNS